MRWGWDGNETSRDGVGQGNKMGWDGMGWDVGVRQGGKQNIGGGTGDETRRKGGEQNSMGGGLRVETRIPKVVQK